MTIKYLDAKRIRGLELSPHSDPVVIGGTSSGTGSSTWADGTQDGSDHTVWYDIRRGVTVGEPDNQLGNGVTGVANNSSNGGDGFTDHPTDTIRSAGGSGAQWKLRFKLTIDSIVTNSSTDVAVGIGMSSSNGDNLGGHQAMFVMKFNNSTRRFYCTGRKGGSWDSSDAQYIEQIGTNMMATGTWYVTLWMPIAMSKQSFYCRVTNNSDYETSTTTSGETNDNDNWGNEDANFVKYFVVGNSKPSSTSVDNHVYFKVEDMKLWNGTLDATTTPTTTIDMNHSTGVPSSNSQLKIAGQGSKSRYTQYNERSPLVIREEANWGKNGTKINFTPTAAEDKTLVTNADTNTIFEEADSKKTFWFQDNIWKRSLPLRDDEATWSTDLSSDSGWTEDNTADIEITGGVIQYKDSDYNYETAYYDMTAIDGITGGISNTAWVLRFKWYLTGTATGDDPLFALSFTEDASQAVTDNGDALGFYLYHDRNNTWRKYFNITKADTTSTRGTASVVDQGFTYSNNTWYYTEFKRDGNQFTIKTFDSADYDTQILDSGNNTAADGTITTIIPSGVGTLRYLTAGHHTQGSGLTVQIDDIKFWNGGAFV